MVTFLWGNVFLMLALMLALICFAISRPGPPRLRLTREAEPHVVETLIFRGGALIASVPGEAKGYDPFGPGRGDYARLLVWSDGRREWRKEEGAVGGGAVGGLWE
ncbi:MAG: hypothetical protein V2A79_10130 [Planctomycetota bacterium]